MSVSASWSFEAIPDPVLGSNPVLVSVSCVGSGCAAVGSNANNRSGHPTTLAEVWSGTAWRLTAAPDTAVGGTGYTSVSCTTTTNCLAVGQGYDDFDGFTGSPVASRRNGTAWTAITVPKPAGQLTGFGAVSSATATACTAVGDSSNPLAFPQTGHHPVAAQWNGTVWTFHPVPVPAGVTYAGLGAVSCPSANRCTAVGSYSTPDLSTTRSLVETWNGTRWSLQPAPAVAWGAYSTSLSAVSCTAVTSCTAVGRSYAAYGAPATPVAVAWNGASWSGQLVTGALSDTALSGISCRTAAECVAVGASGATSQRPRAVAAHLTAGGWRIEATAAPAAGRALADVSCNAAGCHAVGWTITDPVNLAYSALVEHRP